MKTTKQSIGLGILIAAFAATAPAAPIGSAFTYQGRLSDGGAPATGLYDFRFAVHDAGSGGAQVGNYLTNAAVPVTNGLFTTTLDFGDGIFTGAARWLELAVRTNGSTDDFTLLDPRQELTPRPYALYAPTAGTAAGVSGTVAASQLSGTIGSNQIAPGNITSSLLADGAVTTMSLADGAVTAVKVHQVADRQAPFVLSQREFTGQAPSINGNFGYSVALAGPDRILVGARWEASGRGAVYVFQADGALLRKITNPVSGPHFFGSSVAFLGSERVVIGSPNYGFGPIISGAAYLYDLQGNLLAFCSNSISSSGIFRQFGSAVAAVGQDHILVGASADDTGGTDAGAAFLFDTNGLVQTVLTNPVPAAGAQFGFAVAGVGTDRLLIGAQGDNTGATQAGAAYLFDLAGNLLTTFNNPTPAEMDHFGCSVAVVSSNRVLVGASGDDTGATNAGWAYLFDLAGNLLTTISNPTPADTGLFGCSVASAGSDRILIGAYAADQGAIIAGAVYLYDLEGNLLLTFTSPAPAASDYFGFSVAGGYDSVLVGAYRDGSAALGAGAAYLFNLSAPQFTPGLFAEGMRAGSVTTASLADGAVTTAKIGAWAVGSNQLASGAVATANLAEGAVTANKIATVSNWFALKISNPTPAERDYFGISVAAVGSDRVLVGAYGDDAHTADAGAAFLISTNGTLLTTFTNPASVTDDWFGYSVAAVGSDRVLIGALLDDTGTNNAGAAYLFSTNGTLLATFISPTPTASGAFGHSVAAVGNDRVVIGAAWEDSGAENAGSAYLFSTNGTLLATFNNPTPEFYDYFGWSVAAVGNDRVIIGAYRDNTGATEAGAAYLFSTNGTLLTTFTNPTPEGYDSFGHSVAAVGTDRVLIGAHQDSSSASNAGAAYLFSTNGTLLATFNNPTPHYGDSFGHSVAAVGTDRVLIGAYRDDSGTMDAGAVYLFSTNGTLLATFANPAPGPIDCFGYSVAAAENDRVLIGTYRDDAGANDAGAVYLFTLESYTPGLVAESVRAGSVISKSLADGAVTTTTIGAGAVGSNQLASGAVATANLAEGAVTANKIATVSNWFALKISNPSPAANDYFGISLAAVGSDRVLVGAPNDNGAGAAYLFSENGTLLTTFTNPTPTGGDHFSSSVAAVGIDHVLVGAPNDNTGANGAGAAYLFTTSGTLVTTFTSPSPAFLEHFGDVVAAMGGDRVLISTPGDDTGAVQAGVVELFSTNGTLLTTFTNPTPSGSDYFGSSVAAVGNDRVLIGAHGDDTHAPKTGAAYLFSTNGTLLTTFTKPGPFGGGSFGKSVAAVGSDRVLIGADLESRGAAFAGAAFLFGTNGMLLTVFTNPTPAISNFFGFSVASVGSDRVLIGAYGDDAGAINAGTAHLFDTNGALLATFANPTPGTNDYLGSSVAAVGHDQMLIGAYRNDSGAMDAGAAYLFTLQSYNPGLVADGVRAGSVTTASLADGAVTSAKFDLTVGLWSRSGDNVFRLPGKVGVGTNNPTTALHVIGTVTATEFSGNGGGLSNITAANVADGSITADAIADGTIAPADVSSSQFGTVFWKADGNAGTTAGAHFLGTTDNQPVEIKVNGLRALRLQPSSAGSANVIAGSYANLVDDEVFGASIGGGVLNQIRRLANSSTIGGGSGNSIETNAASSVIAGGSNNTIRTNSANSTIGSGYGNTIQANASYAIIGGGYRNTNSGLLATVPGGSYNVATNNAFAAGTRAKANHDGSFVWADSQNADFDSTAANQASFRCQGGVRFTSGSGGGNQTVDWTPGSGSWNFSSDRNLKEGFRPVETGEVLEKVARLPIGEWNYRGYEQRHIGPMAQDFHQEFPLNESKTTLNDADLHGVALAAIQGLNQKLTEELKRRDAENAELKQRLEKLEQMLNQKHGGGK